MPIWLRHNLFWFGIIYGRESHLPLSYVCGAEIMRSEGANEMKSFQFFFQFIACRDVWAGSGELSSLSTAIVRIQFGILCQMKIKFNNFRGKSTEVVDAGGGHVPRDFFSLHFFLPATHRSSYTEIFFYSASWQRWIEVGNGANGFLCGFMNVRWIYPA